MSDSEDLSDQSVTESMLSYNTIATDQYFIPEGADLDDIVE